MCYWWEIHVTGGRYIMYMYVTERKIHITDRGYKLLGDTYCDIYVIPQGNI